MFPMESLFSKSRVKKLIEKKLGSLHFDQGSLVNEKKQFSDMSEYDAVFATNGNTHGVILVTDGCKPDFAAFHSQLHLYTDPTLPTEQDTCKMKMNYVIGTMFKNSAFTASDEVPL